ncbi:MAG: DUF4129 domain-containing protein [Anaerolineae bacterium]
MNGQGRRREVRIHLGMWWRLALITGMMAAMMSTMLDAVHAAGVGWRGSYLVFAIALLPLETFISQRMVRRRELRSDELTRFHLAEGITLVLLLQLLRYIDQGLPAIGGRVERLLDVEFFLGGMILLGFWSVAAAMIRWFQDLDYQPDEKAPPVTSPDYDLWVSSRVRHVEHTAAFQRISATFLIGGIFILILGGAARVDPAAIIDFQRGTIRALILHVLVYFVLGMALIAEARLSLLHTRWQHEEVNVSRSVSRRWPVLVGGLLLLAVVVALLLPVDYSVGIIDALQQAINYLVTAAVTIAYALLYLVGLLLYPLQWLMSLGRGGAEGEQPSMPEFAAPTPTPSPAGTPPLLDALKSLLFWLIALGIAGYALYNFGREHGATLRGMKLLRPLWALLGALAGLWRWLRRGATRAGRAVAKAVRRRAQQAQVSTPMGRRLRRMGQMSPRELVQYYYLSTVQRAEATGLRRRPNETADEFSGGLAASLPEVDQDVDALTAAFVEAKYSAHVVPPERAQGLRPFWERVRQALRRLRRERQAKQ